MNQAATLPVQSIEPVVLPEATTTLVAPYDPQRDASSTELTTVVATSSDPTADWKVYHNEKYGFEMRFPREWYLYRGAADTYFAITNYNPETGSELWKDSYRKIEGYIESKERDISDFPRSCVLRNDKLGSRPSLEE